MFTELCPSIRRLRAISVLSLAFGVLGVGTLVLSTDYSWAEDSLPIPARKPDVAQRASAEDPQVRGKIVQYSLKDFTKALLNYGQPPTPSVKPVLASAGEGPIAETEAQRYKKIFELQAQGKMDEADKEIAQLQDFRLRGHMLYQRYMHPTAYTSSFDELRNWLALYADHPNANKIYKLAESKRPEGFSGKLREPESAIGIVRRTEPMMVAARTYRPSKTRTDDERTKVSDLNDSIRYMIRKRQPDEAYERLKTDKAAKLLDAVEYDILRTRIAARYMYSGELDKAYELSSASAKRSGLQVPMAGWTAGLVAWEKGNFKTAAKYFEMTARSPYASGWTVAGGAYWAARSHMKAGNVKQVSPWLERAVEYPRTFYGLVATRALGRNFDFNWDFPTFTKEYLEELQNVPAGARAIALNEAGQNHLAEAELLRIRPETDKMRDALLSYAGYAGLPALAMRIGGAYEASDGVYYDAALYPKSNWKPKGGFKIDSALVHAIMRQESRFDYNAESPSGARGLMQLMPATARHVAGRRLKDMEMLSDPVFNVELGEKYLKELLGERRVDGDLISLLIAYNAGPGNLSHWKKQWEGVEDPLLFIELISSKETRAYVERVLANYWIYRLREGHPTPTLNAIAEGKNARYADAQKALGDAEFQVASSR